MLNKQIIDNHSLHEQLDFLLRRFMLLDINAPMPSSIFDDLLVICRESSPKCRPLLNELDKHALSSRQKVICLLIHKNKINPKEMWIYAGCANEAAFRTTKSQIKRKLLEAAATSREIQELLACFPQDRGPAPQPIPDVKNKGKKIN